MRPRRLAQLVAVPALVLACRQIVGVESREAYDAGPGEDDAAPVCGIPSPGDAACDGCMRESCCGEAELCADITGCPEIEACIQACPLGDAACVLACSGPFSPASQARITLGTCRGHRCARECLGTEGGGDGVGSGWACLGKVRWQPQNPETRAITITAQILGENGQPVAGVLARICSDPACSPNLLVASDESDEDGRVSLRMRLTPDASASPTLVSVHSEGFLDQLATLAAPPAYFDRDLGTAYLVASSALDEIYAQLGVVRDSSRVTVAVDNRDCFGTPATGVVVTFAEADEAATVLYASDAEELASSSLEATGRLGVAIGLNLPMNEAVPGVLRVETHLAATGQRISEGYVFARPDALSATLFYPSPEPAP